MRFNKVNLFFIIIVLMSLVIGCGSKTVSNDTTEKTIESESIEKIKVGNIQMIAGNATGGWTMLSSAIAEKTNEWFEGYPITASPGGSVGNIPSVSIGNADIGMSYAPFLIAALNCDAPYEESFTNLKAVAALPPTITHIVGIADLPVETFDEVFDKKLPITIGLPPKGQGSNYIANTIFSALDLNIEDSKAWEGKAYYSSDLVDAWRDRHIDIQINTANVPAGNLEESLSARKGKFLPLSNTLMEMLVKEKGFVPYTIPAGTYTGQEQDEIVPSLGSIIFARDDVSEDLIYYMTKTIYENKDYLVGVHNSMKEFDREKMATGLGLDLHEGAKRFYKEVGLIE